MRIRNNKELLMSDIIERYEKRNLEDKSFRRRFAIRVNQLKLSQQDLHYMLHKECKNWSKFVNGVIKTKRV